MIFFRKRIKFPHIFLHLHKCGGTTLMECIDVNYQKENIYEIDGSRYRDSYLEFQQLPQNERFKIDLLRGHHFYGSHEYLRPNAKYFTMLREPVSRLTSLYNYLKEIDLYKDINRKDMGLQAFLDSGLAMAADNGMTRMLTNKDFDLVANGKMTVEMAYKAIENIEENFIVVGITEQFDESLRLFKDRLGWKKRPSYETQNRTSKKTVSQKDVQDFFDNNPSYLKYIQPDQVLYNFVLKKFENDILT